jgi:WD40 repeat protein
MDCHDAIQFSPLQIYVTAHLFLPHSRLSCDLNENDSSSARLVSKRVSAWPPQTFSDKDGEAMAISCDGSQLVAGSYSMQILDAWTGTPNSAFTSGKTCAVAFTPDGTRIVSGGDDEKISIRDSATGELIHVIANDKSAIITIAISPDGAYIASSSKNSTSIRIWCLTSNVQLKLLEHHQDEITGLIYSADNSILVSSSHDKTVSVWDTRSESCRKHLIGHKDVVNCVDISGDSTLIASGSDDKTIRIWNTMSSQQLRIFKGSKSRVKSIKFDLPNSLLISGHKNCTIRVWNVTSGTCTATLFGHTHSVASVLVTPCNTRFFSASENEIMVWDMIALQQRSRPSVFIPLQDSPDIAARSTQGTVRDRLSRAQTRIEQILQKAQIQDYSFELSEHTINDPIAAFAVSRDNAAIAVGSVCGEIQLWNGARTRTLKGSSYLVRTLAFSNNGSWLASGTDDGTSRVWNVGTGRAVAKLRHPNAQDEDWIVCLSFSPDSSLLAVGDKASRLAVWSTSTWSLNWSSESHTSYVRSVAFSPNSHLLISGSHDHSVRVWNAANGLCLAKLIFELQRGGWIDRVAFIDNGSRIVAIGLLGSIRVWDAHTVGYPELEGKTLPSLFFLHTDDWLYGPVSAVGPVCRLIWIPPSRRLYFRSQIEVHCGLVTLVSRAGATTQLDISGLLNQLSSEQAA